MLGAIELTKSSCMTAIESGELGDEGAFRFEISENKDQLSQPSSLQQHSLGGASNQNDVTERLLFLLLVPSFVQTMGMRMGIPILPLFAQQDLGASSTTIGTIVAVMALGKLLCNIPSGWLVSNCYDSDGITSHTFTKVHWKSLVPILCSCLGMASVYLAAAVWVNSPTELICVRLGAGAFLSLWQIGRQTLMNHLLTKDKRGRYMSTVGGTARMAAIVGPYLGGFLATQTDNLRTPFLGQAVLSLFNALLVGSIMVWIHGQQSKRRAEYVPVLVEEQDDSTKASEAACSETETDQEGAEDDANSQNCQLASSKIARTMTWGELLSSHAKILANLALFCFCMAMVRESRHLLFPLQAMDMGYDAHAIGIMTSITFMVDSAFFPMAGYLMDHYGRKYSGVPSMSIIGLCAALTPVLVRLHPSSIVALTFASAGCGLGNGLSSGLLMSLGGDLSPANGSDRAKFLAIYRNFADSGLLLGPWVSGMLADFDSVLAGFQVIACVAFGGAFWMAVMIPETHAPT